jgi:hypothetical protein
MSMDKDFNSPGLPHGVMNSFGPTGPQDNR